MLGEKMGLVIRDPWYEFGTYPGKPHDPNTVFQDSMGKILAELGARWVRLEFHIEGADVADQVARNDYFIKVVAPRHGFRVLGLLGFDLLRGQNERNLFHGPIQVDELYGGGVNDYMHTWLDRARYIAERYKGLVHAYEILNEPNRLPPDGMAIPATVVARLHTKFYRFFRQVDRYGTGDQTWRDNVPILIGGLHPAGTGTWGRPEYISDLDYLYEIYTSDGFAGYKRAYGTFPADGLAYHPYPEEIRRSLHHYPRGHDARWEARMLAYRLDELRQVLHDVGHPDLPIWITEIGYNVAYADHDEHGQAEFLEVIEQMLTRRADVAVNFWFKYEDFPPAQGPDAQQWGIVHIPFSERPYPGGVRYDPQGEPDRTRAAYNVYYEMAHQEEQAHS